MVSGKGDCCGVLNYVFWALWAPQATCHLVPLHWREGRRLSNQCLQLTTKQLRAFNIHKTYDCSARHMLVIRTVKVVFFLLRIVHVCITIPMPRTPSASNHLSRHWGQKNILGLWEPAEFWIILKIHTKYVKSDARGEVKENRQWSGTLKLCEFI